MLLRAVGRQMTSVIRQQTAIRNIAISRVALGGGGHHHDPQPVYIPKPGSLDWSLCGNTHAKSAHPHEPHKTDVGSLVGAAVFIGLTVAAVLFKTDTFKKDDVHHHGHHGKHSAHKKEVHHEKPKEEHFEHVENRKPEEVLAAREAPAAVEDPVPSTSKHSEVQKAAAAAAESTETKSAEPEEHSAEHPEPAQHRLPEEVHAARGAPAAVEEPVPSTSKPAEEPTSSESKEEVQ